MSKSQTIYIWIPELAERWGVTVRTIYRWVAKGEIGETGIPFTHSRVGRRIGWTESQARDLEAEMTKLQIAPPLQATAS